MAAEVLVFQARGHVSPAHGISQAVPKRYFPILEIFLACRYTNVAQKREILLLV